MLLVSCVTKQKIPSCSTDGNNVPLFVFPIPILFFLFHTSLRSAPSLLCVTGDSVNTLVALKQNECINSCNCVCSTSSTSFLFLVLFFPAEDARFLHVLMFYKNRIVPSSDAGLYRDHSCRIVQTDSLVFVLFFFVGTVRMTAVMMVIMSHP